MTEPKNQCRGNCQPAAQNIESYRYDPEVADRAWDLLNVANYYST